MNTVNTSKTATKALVTCLISAGVLCGAAALADQVGPSSLTRTVSIQDLDLSTVSGQHLARERVYHLARTLCEQVADPTDMSHHANYLACVDVTEAKVQVRLQALIDKQSPARFAQSNSN